MMKQRQVLEVGENEVMFCFIATRAQKRLWLHHIKKTSPRGGAIKLEDWILLTLDSEAGGLS